MMDVPLITILLNGGDVIAAACQVSSRSGRELPGLYTALLGRCPVIARLLTQGVDCGVEGGKEVVWIEVANELITLEFLSYRFLKFGKHQ